MKEQGGCSTGLPPPCQESMEEKIKGGNRSIQFYLENWSQNGVSSLQCWR